MNKNMMNIAILTASLLVASCGNKQAAPAVDVESLQPAIEQAQSAGQQSETMNTIDKPSFSFAIPEGWLQMPGDNDDEKESAMVFRGRDVSELMDAAFMMINIVDDEGKTLEEGLEDFRMETQAKQSDDVTIGGKIYKAFTAVEEGTESTIVVSHEGNKFISFIIGKANIQDPDVRAIINSFKLK